MIISWRVYRETPQDNVRDRAGALAWTVAGGHHRFRWTLLGICVLAASAAFAQPRWNPPIPSIGSTNLLPNSSFELGPDGWSSLGLPTAWGGDLCGLVGTIQAGGAVDGGHCLRIELGPGKTLVTHSDYTLGASATTVQAAPLAANLGWLDVTPGNRYTLSAYMRAEPAGVTAKLVFRFGGDINTGFGADTHTRRVTLTGDWARYSFTMEAYEPDLFVAVGPDLTATPDASATVWIDAVQVEESVVEPPVGPVTLTENFDSGFLGGIWGYSTIWNAVDTSQVIDGALNFHKTGAAANATAAVSNLGHALTGDFTLEFTIPRLADFAVDDGPFLMPRFVVSNPSWTDMIWLLFGRSHGQYVVLDGIAGTELLAMPLTTTSCTVRLIKTPGQMVCQMAPDGGAFVDLGLVGGSWNTITDTNEVALYLLAQDWYSAVKGPFDIAIDDLTITAVGLPAAEGDATPYVPREPVEVGITTEHYGDVYDAADPIHLAVHGSNTTAAPASVEVQAQWEDYFGELGAVSSMTLDVPANARVTGYLPLNTPGPGYYRAHVSWSTGGVAHERSFPMAVIETYAWNDSPFGINHAPTTASASAQLKRGGTTWARDWSVKWDSVEPVEGAYDFPEIDRQLNRIGDEGLNPLVLLPPQPSAQWATEAPGSVPAGWERAAYAPPPADRPQLNAFIGATAARYAGRVTYWEFLNEPLWTGYALPAAGSYNVDTYIALLQGAVAAMRAADPECRILGGLSIMAHSTMGDEFIQKGGLNYVDIYNLHPYPTGVPEEFIGHMQRILGVMDANGGRKPIWATELGYWGTDAKPWTPWTPPNPDHWAANRQQASEREAADFNLRHAVILLAHNVKKIFWHSGLEGEINNGSYDLEDPLMGREATPQKFYPAQAALAHLLGPDPVFAAPFQKPDSVDGASTAGVHGYAFTGQDRAVLVVWAPGELNNGTARSGRLAPLGESPVYLTSRTNTAEQLAQACALVRDVEPGTEANGWGNLISAPLSAPYHSPFGEYTIHIARALDGTQELVWETQDVPMGIDTGGTFAFRWVGATGYAAQPEGAFALYLGGTKLLDFGLALTSTSWTGLGGACTLDYQVLEVFSGGEDSAGIMTLTVPASLLVPGTPAQLRVVGSNAGSQRWTGIYACPSTASGAGWAVQVPDTVAAYSVVGTPMLPDMHALPAAPVIVTNGGQDFTVGITPVLVQGTCDPAVADVRLGGASVSHTPGASSWEASVDLALGPNPSEFVTVDSYGYSSLPATITITLDRRHDTDQDGIPDWHESRDLDPGVPGIQNPFDPASDDSTGEHFSPEPDGTPDGHNDWDGDGMSNADEFTWGSNPIDPDDIAQLPAVSRYECALVVLLSLAAWAVQSHRHTRPQV